MSPDLNVHGSWSLWLCWTCGMVRASDVSPWCRHYALDVPARRMVPLPEHHPIFGEPVENWREGAISHG